MLICGKTYKFVSGMEGCLYIEVILPVKLAWHPVYRVPGAFLAQSATAAGDIAKAEDCAGASISVNVEHNAEATNGIKIGDRVSVRLHGRLLPGVVSAILPASRFGAGSNNGGVTANDKGNTYDGGKIYGDCKDNGSIKIGIDGKDSSRNKTVVESNTNNGGLTDGGIKTGIDRKDNGSNKTGIDGKVMELDLGKIHDIVSIDRHLKPVTPEEIKLWQFMADYYLCTVGEVFKCAYPSSKMKSEQTAARVAARAEESARRKSQERREKAGRAIERLHSRIETRVKALEGKHSETVTARLNAELEALRAELAEAEAELKALCEGTTSEASLEGQELEAPLENQTQKALNGSTTSEASLEGQTQKTLNEGQTQKALREGTTSEAPLENQAQKTLSGSTEADCENQAPKTGSQQPQTTVIAPEIDPGIKKLLNPGKPLLVRALDRSTLYQALEMECISRGRSVLHLVPDIAFTAELEDRMRTTFGGSLLLYHSRQTEASRRDTADALRHSSGPRVILGTRSAIFLPFKDLGLIIVDEEQDPSYKQDSPAPRYNTRDTAVVLAQIHACPLILGSVTPSLETVHNCVSGRFKLWESDECRRLGEVTVIDTAAERRKRGMVGQFSRKLLAEIDLTLQGGGKVVLLRGWGSTSDTAAEIAGIFAGCKVAHDEPEGEWDILVGTVAGTKRMSLPDGCLLAFLQADTLLGAPDFRADERAMQVFDRFRLKCAGGRFIIQTSRSEHLLMQESASDERYRWLLDERQAFGYPPYSRIVDIVLRDANEKRRELMVGALGRSLSEAGFVPGRIDKTGRRDVADSRNIDVILRVPILRDKSFGVRKGELRKLVEGFEVARRYSGFIHLDVDPQ